MSVVYHVRASIKLPGLRVKRLSHHAIINWLPSGHLYIQSDILLCGDVKSQPGPSSRSDSRHGLFGLEDKSSVSNANTSLNLKLSSVGPSSKLHTPSLHCFYQNVRSIKSGNKLRQFQDTLYANQFDIVAISGLGCQATYQFLNFCHGTTTSAAVIAAPRPVHLILFMEGESCSPAAVISAASRLNSPGVLIANQTTKPSVFLSTSKGPISMA